MTNLLNRLNRILYVALTVIAFAFLGGCASSVPDITNIQRVSDDALTPSELKRTIDNMTDERNKQQKVTASASHTTTTN